LPSDIQEIAGVVPDSVINKFSAVLGIEVEDVMDTSDSLQQKKTSFESINKEVKSLMREGYSATQILSQVKPSIIS